MTGKGQACPYRGDALGREVGSVLSDDERSLIEAAAEVMARERGLGADVMMELDEAVVRLVEKRLAGALRGLTGAPVGGEVRRFRLRRDDDR